MIEDPNYIPEVVQVIASPACDYQMRALTVMNGTAAWDIAGTRDEWQCIDLDPVVLYRESQEIDEPDWVLRGAQ